MTAPHRTSPASGTPRTSLLGTATLHDRAWAHERDDRFARFLAQRLAVVEATGCLAERKLAAGMLDLSTQWHHQRELSTTSDRGSSAEADALGWALRCLAHSAWHNAPGWEPDFHPGPAPTLSPTVAASGYALARRP